MSFDTFESGPKKRGAPAVSINKYGHWTINKSLATECSKRKVKSFLLRFDAENCVIALQPTEADDSRGCVVDYGQRERDKTGAVINAGSFLKWISYDASETRTFLVHWNEKTEQFELSIDAIGGTDHGRKRTKKG